MKHLLSPNPIKLPVAISCLRISIGLLITYHGFEVFNSEIMEGYLKWDIFKSSHATFFVYMGKLSELISGILLIMGLFTRVSAVMLFGTMIYITFFVGQGRFWYEDQHPFLFALFAVLFFFSGPGMFSLDSRFYKKSDH